MNKNKNVLSVYNKLSSWFDDKRTKDLFEKYFLDKALGQMQFGDSILDLGCGAGEPFITYFLEKGFEITAVDGSKEMLNIAKARFPKVEFILQDMREIALNKKFHCIIAWHSFFHLPRDDQKHMFKIFQKHLHPQGFLLFTSGTENSEIWSDNGGEQLYHASLSIAEYKQILNKYNFNLIDCEIKSEQLKDATAWIAQLK